MPSYMTHSVHGKLVSKDIEKRIEIDDEDIKTFCFGFDTLMLPDYKLFEQQHKERTKEYFEALLSIIKKRKLQDDPETMAFLYGQLDHFILDLTTHPLIFYMTTNLEKNHILDYHALVESWLDNYVLQKYGENKLLDFHKWEIKNKELNDLIDELYRKVYNTNNAHLKYNLGIKLINLYEKLLRRNKIKIAPLLCKITNFGEVSYKDNYEEVLPFLNLEHNIWYDPETEEKQRLSFDDLWNQSIENSEEAIYDVNNYLYNDKPLKTKFIKDNLSANTGINCEISQKYKRLKRYKR